jgi:predicted enzyme involved in methoxymalonyl-ACP biosynthesis
VIVRYASTVAYVDTFLMSCRVLGRDVELSPWSAIAADARARGCDHLTAEWLHTARNAQVERFFDDRLGLECVAEPDGARCFASPLDALSLQVPTHIEVTSE